MTYDERVRDNGPLPGELREALRTASSQWAATHPTEPLRERIVAAALQANARRIQPRTWWAYAAAWARPVIPIGFAAALLVAVFGTISLTDGSDSDADRNILVLGLALGDDLAIDALVRHVVTPGDQVGAAR